MQTYDYFKSVLAPFVAPSPPLLPDIPYQGSRSRVMGNTGSKDHVVPAGGYMEALLVSPCLYTSTFENTISKLVTFYSSVSPSTTGLIYSRYGASNDTMTLSSAAITPMYLHKASVQIYASAPVTYETCMYAKTLANNAENPDAMFALPQAQTGTLKTTDRLWINALPIHFEKRAFDPNSTEVYRPGVSVHYLVRIKNNSASNITVYVRNASAFCHGEREDGIADHGSALSIKSSPLGFTHYVFEKLRYKYCIMLIDSIDLGALEARQDQIEIDVKNAIKELAQNWYDMLRAVPGLDINKLINFIIFYLE